MDIGKSFSYIFEDKDWLAKVLIGSVITLISIPFTIVLVGFLGLAIVSGYTLEVLRNVRQGVARPLPEWRDRWSEWLVLGLKLWLALFAWSLPALVLNLFSGFGQSMMATNSDLLNVFGGMIVVFIGCLSFIWWVIVALATPAISIRLAETEDLGSAFRFNDIYVFTRDHIGDVVIAVLVTFVASIVATVVGSVAGVLLCIIGLAITLPAAWFIAQLISVHLYAQVGKSGPRTVRRTSGPEGTPTAPVEVVTPDNTVIRTETPRPDRDVAL